VRSGGIASTPRLAPPADVGEPGQALFNDYEQRGARGAPRRRRATAHASAWRSSRLAVNSILLFRNGMRLEARRSSGSVLGVIGRHCG
jgi:hypothetical protein